MRLHDCLEKIVITDCLSGVDENKIMLEGGDRKSNTDYLVELTDVDIKEMSLIKLEPGRHSSLIDPDINLKGDTNGRLNCF